jgi:hypothetical protein
MKMFIQDVIRKKEPKERRKMKLIKQKHKESYIRLYLLFMAMFKEEWFWPLMKKMCEVESRNYKECLKYNIGKVGFHSISLVMTIPPIDHVAINFIELL